MFVGFKPELRTDDPENEHEFTKNDPTEEKLKARFTSMEKIWDWMRDVKLDYNRYKAANNKAVVPDLPSDITIRKKMFNTSTAVPEQPHWTTERPEDWGRKEKGKVYKLK